LKTPADKMKEYEDRRSLYFTRAERDYTKQVAKVMRDALDEIRSKMSKIYEKYAVNGILTKAQMTQYNRLATLEAEVIGIMKPAEKAALKIIDKLRPEEYGEAFFRTAWAVDNATGVGLKWGPLNKDTVIANLDNPFYTSAKESILVNTVPQFRNAINKGLALGESYPQMMADIKKVVNGKNYEIMRVLVTELHNSQEAGTADSYDTALEQGVNGKVVWIATLDDRTRETHQQMDGVERDEDGMFRGAVGETPYPGWEGMEAAERIACRCDIRFEIEGFEPTVRRSREDGILPSQNYDTWIKDKQVFK